MQERRATDRRRPNQWYRKGGDRRTRPPAKASEYKAAQRAGALRTQAQLDLLRQAIASPIHWTQAHAATLQALARRGLVAWDASQNRWVATDIGQNYEQERRAKGRTAIVT